MPIFIFYHGCYQLFVENYLLYEILLPMGDIWAMQVSFDIYVEEKEAELELSESDSWWGRPSNMYDREGGYVHMGYGVLASGY